MSGDMADFINDSAPDNEECETCGGDEGFHNEGCPECGPGSETDSHWEGWEENNEQLG